MAGVVLGVQNATDRFETWAYAWTLVLLVGAGQQPSQSRDGTGIQRGSPAIKAPTQQATTSAVG